jgi:hypothetical protein
MRESLLFPGALLVVAVMGAGAAPLAANQPPVIDVRSSWSAMEGELLAIPFVVLEPENEQVTYAVEHIAGGVARSTLPQGAYLDVDPLTAARTFNWFPAAGQAGAYEFRFKAVDERGAAAAKTVTVAVATGRSPLSVQLFWEPSWNVFRALAPPFRHSVREWQSMSLRIQPYNAAGNPVSVQATLHSAADGTPVAATLGSAPGYWNCAPCRQWKWLPKSNDAGLYNGTVTISDTVTGARLQVPVSLEVRDAPDPREYLYAVTNLHNLKAGNTAHSLDWAVVKGRSVALDLVFKHTYGRGGERAVSGVSLRYVVFTPQGEREISPVLTDRFAHTWDSTALPDGTYALGIKFIDAPNLQLLRFRPLSLIVDNLPGPVTGPQDVPVIGFFYDDDYAPAAVDWVRYGGTRASPAVHPYPYQRVPSARTLSNPASLVDNNKMWFTEPLVHAILPLYEDAPSFYRTAAGHVITAGFLPESDNTSEKALEAVKRHDLYDGGRNDNTIDPYSTLVPDPAGPGWYGVDISGRVFRVEPAGRVTTVAGWVSRKEVLPIDYRDLSTPYSVFSSTQKKLIGSFQNDVLLEKPNDLAFDPFTPGILYIADTGNHRIAKIDLRGTVAVITTFAGAPGQKGYSDGPAGAARFNEPYSLVASPADGSLYVADMENNAIRKVSPQGVVTTVAGASTRTAVPAGDAGKQLVFQQKDSSTANKSISAASINYPQVIRLDSRGNLIVGEPWTRSVRRVNFSSGMVERIAYLPGKDSHQGTWIWLDVDVKGNIGPADDILVAISETLSVVSNRIVWRFSADGSRGGEAVPHGWPSSAYSGRANHVFEPVGHYPWAVAIDDEEARFVTTGFGTSGLVSLRMVLPSDPESYHHETFQRGFQIFDRGTVPAFPFGSRPGFAAVHGSRGYSRLGNVLNFDDLRLLSDEDLAAYIQDSMGGSTPRPEITGNDLRDVIYFIRQTSLQGITSRVVPGPDAADSRAPEIREVEVRPVDASTTWVLWRTDESTIGVVEYGRTNYYGRFSAIEEGYSKEHQVKLEGLPRGHAFRFRIIARDVAGNRTMTPDGALGLSTAGGAPIAQNQSLSASANTVLSGYLSAVDPAGGALTFSIVAPPQRGTVELNAGSGAFTYTPQRDFQGADLFSFRAASTAASSNLATVSITVGGGTPPASNVPPAPPRGLRVVSP